jgi:hypothetical protein
MANLVKVSQVNKTVTTAGTRVALAAATQRVRSLMIQAESTNTGVIYIGDITVSSTVKGATLTAGNSLTIEAPVMGQAGADDLDLASIYIDSSVNGDKVSVLFIARN